jgi:hypothetical protein
MFSQIIDFYKNLFNSAFNDANDALIHELLK